MHASLFRRFSWGVAGLVLTLATANVLAQPMSTALNEQVLMLGKHTALFTFQLETTIYRPPGEGPFPLVVINHGKAAGDPRFQGRYQPTNVARFFVRRGYAVVVPMRQGFSKSEGSYIGGGCNVESNGRVQAEDLKAVLDDVTALPWVDKTRILVMGQSHGGWSTLAFGTLAYPGVLGLVNFAGGLRQEACPGWEGGLARAAAAYGAETHVPSLWFYGENDSYFSPLTSGLMHQRYVAAGGRSDLVSFGTFGSDAHSMFGSTQGESIWQTRVLSFMQSVGLPTDLVVRGMGDGSAMPTPPPSHFADVTDVDKVPYLGVKGREGYRKFLTQLPPRAFAVAASGAWGWARDGDDPLVRALANCNKNSKDQSCRLYAVGEQTVWSKD